MSAHKQAALAEKHGENLAAQEYSTCSRLLLEAAQIEAERIELERRRKREQKRVDRAKVLRIRHLRARQKVEREVALIQAAQKAKALDTADFRQSKKRRNKEQTRGLQRAVRKRSSRLAIKRARIYLASAVAMGVDDPLIEKARRSIREALNQPIGSVSSARKAEQALLSAVDALGTGRAKNDGPTRDEKNTLLNEARKEGFSVEPFPTGMVVKLPGLFVGQSRALSVQGKGDMKKLSYLVRAHPHGSIEIRQHTGSTDRPNRKRLAKARAARIVSSLSTDKPKERRFKVAFDTFAPDEEEVVKLVFVAYGRSAR